MIVEKFISPFPYNVVVSWVVEWRELLLSCYIVIIITPFLCFMKHLQMVCKDINSRLLDAVWYKIYRYISILNIHSNTGNRCWYLRLIITVWTLFANESSPRKSASNGSLRMPPPGAGNGPIIGVGGGMDILLGLKWSVDDLINIGWVEAILFELPFKPIVWPCPASIEPARPLLICSEDLVWNTRKNES